uniref:Uncharacterized protein n=1 Tax=Anguilla anguilla TaxID=7936 RepID=A0A0E9S5J0_ANGAN
MFQVVESCFGHISSVCIKVQIAVKYDTQILA